MVLIVHTFVCYILSTDKIRTLQLVRSDRLLIIRGGQWEMVRNRRSAPRNFVEFLHVVSSQGSLKTLKPGDVQITHTAAVSNRWWDFWPAAHDLVECMKTVSAVFNMGCSKTTTRGGEPYRSHRLSIGEDPCNLFLTKELGASVVIGIDRDKVAIQFQ